MQIINNVSSRQTTTNGFYVRVGNRNSILLAILLSQCLSGRSAADSSIFVETNCLLCIQTGKQVFPTAHDRVRSQCVPSLSATYLCGAMLFWSSKQERFRMRRNSVAGVVNKRQRRPV